MKPLAIFPLLYLLFVLHKRDWRHAYVFGLIPPLLLLPNYYTWKLPGIPVFTFHNYLWVVLAVVMFQGKERKLYRFHWMDLIIVVHVLWYFLSELTMKNYADAQNLVVLRAMAILLPYLLGRAIGSHNGLLCSTLLMMGVVGAFIGTVSPYEARMGINPFDDFLRRNWGGAIPWDGALYRGGIRRVAGPFAHAICHGFYFSLVLPFVLWLLSTGAVKNRWLKIWIVFGCILGLLTPLSRGPILGTLLAIGTMFMGWTKARVPVFATAILVGTFGGILVAPKVIEYVSITRADAKTPEQETAAYRNEMLINYLDMCNVEPMWGFGKDNFPVVKNQKSIDNQYLFLTLSHGYPSAITFFLAMLVPALVMIPKLFRRHPSDPLGRLGWTGVGMMFGAIFTQLTVFAGTQTVEVLYTLSGVVVETNRRLATEPKPRIR